MLLTQHEACGTHRMKHRDRGSRKGTGADVPIESLVQEGAVVDAYLSWNLNQGTQDQYK